MAQTAEQWFDELSKEAGLTQEQSAYLRTIFQNNEKATGRLNAVLKTAQDDYNAQVGRVRALDEEVKNAKAQYENQVRTTNNWWNGEHDAQGRKIKQGAYDVYQQALKERDEALARLNGTTTTQTVDEGKFVSKDDLNRMLAERDARYASVLKDGIRVGSRHAVKFHEELDTDALEKVATEEGLTLAQAYDKMVKPRVEAAENARIQKEKDEYADQKLKDYLSAHKMPVDPIPQETAPMYRRFKPEEVIKDTDADLLAAWHGVK